MCIRLFSYPVIKVRRDCIYYASIILHCNQYTGIAIVRQHRKNTRQLSTPSWVSWVQFVCLGFHLKQRDVVQYREAAGETGIFNMYDRCQDIHRLNCYLSKRCLSCHHSLFCQSQLFSSLASVDACWKYSRVSSHLSRHW